MQGLRSSIVRFRWIALTCIIHHQTRFRVEDYHVSKKLDPSLDFFFLLGGCSRCGGWEWDERKVKVKDKFDSHMFSV